jgi:adenylylsulfate kinase
MKENIHPHNHLVRREDREMVLNQRGRTIWFTGLSGSGKSTIASNIELTLNESGYATYILDGDNVRMGLCSGLGFSPEGRKENLRRIAETCKLFNDAGIIVFACFISPYETDRQMVRSIIGKDYFEVFVSTSLDVCEDRDPKGLYKKARAGEIKGFTGIDSPYEVPKDPDMVIETAGLSARQCAFMFLENFSL